MDKLIERIGPTYLVIFGLVLCAIAVGALHPSRRKDDRENPPRS